ncbi:hypothetical protein E3N88_16906 [Mikania micrantha]|uniref:Ty3 transposon capsid-like protein domain-containing protein n=1 Tax=Mikania micrantha TaxID=192012 RepID=A0A5N6NRU8_9ASTR|nr:hypothetical protein E3N88_16906 [Mikania micrantha]
METRTNTCLDAQELQIKQLQSDVVEIKNTPKVLEEDRLESGEFRKVVLAWMKHQEKQHVEGSPGSGTFSNPHSHFGPILGPSDSSSGVPWAVKKIQLPEFSGFDPQGWIQKATLYFEINNTPEDLRIRLAQMSMVGVAQHWFTVIRQLRDSISWADFKLELLQRFSGLEIHNPYEQLATIQQGDSILDYLDDFEYLLSLVPSLSESQALGYFIAGLKDDVKKWVRLHRPTSRLDAMYLAKDVEHMLRPASFSGNVSHSRFRNLNQTGPFAPDGPPLLGPTDSKQAQVHRNSEKSFSYRQDSSRSTPPFKQVFSSSSTNSSNVPRDRGVRSLSRTDWEDRRKKGLCYRCGQQYGPAHKCPEGKLRTCLALQFDGLLAETGGVKTLRFEGTLYDIPITIMVDSGATHNFISSRLVSALGLPILTFAGIAIKLGDGHSVFVSNRCVHLPIQLGLGLFSIDALVFDTGSLDLILGMAWLHSLGEVVHDWQHSWMRFTHKGKSIMLQGLSSPPTVGSALNQWLLLDELPLSSSSCLVKPKMLQVYSRRTKVVNSGK